MFFQWKTFQGEFELESIFLKPDIIIQYKSLDRREFLFLSETVSVKIRALFFKAEKIEKLLTSPLQ